MSDLGELIAALAAQLPTGAGGSEAGLELEVTGLDLEVPLEARLIHGGALRASLPRGRLATGFTLPLGRLSAHFGVRRSG